MTYIFEEHVATIFRIMTILRNFFQLLTVFKIKLCLIKHYTMKTYGGVKVKNLKAIPITGCGGPQGCEMRLPHFLDRWLTDGSGVVSLLHQPAALLYPGRFLVLIYVRG
jgi:hypothetical protein